jgi:NAD(P)-dependent dehydrogenase (short-subunit alcohol dehydrogenase family)
VALVDAQAPLADAALAHFHALFAKDDLVIDKWFTLQATANEPAGGGLQRVKALMQHPDFSLKNPNRARALLSGFCRDNPAAFHKQSMAGFRSIFDSSFFGNLHLAHAAWPHLVQQGYGRMVLTASSAGLHANHGQSAYSAAKAAVIGLMRALAIEGGRHQVRVNVIAPYGYSQMTAPYMPPDMARSFDPALVAPLVSWLCSEACDTTGEVLVSGAGLVRRAGVGESDALPLQDGSVADAVHGLESKALQPYGSANDSFARFLQELERMSPPTHPSTTP